MAASAKAIDDSLKWAGLLLGFSLGGFFDGILLHQILQWHHLLSGVGAVQDMRMQLLADGLFHALMYVIAAVALYKLWRARRATAEPGAGTALCGSALAGFGAWHMVDGILSHWLLGIHRIKMDSPNPLLWDLVWFVAFGLLPLVLGWLMLRRSGNGGAGGTSGRSAAVSLGLAALIAGPLAALPGGERTDNLIVIFAPGVSGRAAFNALAEVDARVLWADRSGAVWAVNMQDPKASSQLYRSGAMLLSNSTIALGCLSWSRASGAGANTRPL